MNLGDLSFNVIIIKKNIKNTYFRFDEDLNLVVSTNNKIKEKEIMDLIKKNETSILNLYQEREKKLIKSQEFWYLGNKYNVIYNSNLDGVEIKNDTIISKNINELNKFLKENILKIFIEEINYYKKIIKTPNFKVRIRKMKTRWGVCNYKKNIITLNSDLIRYNIECLKYVIVHEMCHFYHHNHSKEFWALVGHYYPDYKLRNKELKY